MDTAETYSVEQCIDFIGLGKYQWRLISILGFCSMADAVEMMLLAVLGPALTCEWPNITQMQIASITTGVFAGMMLGAFISGILADKFGRKRIVAISALLNTFFGVLTAFAPNYYWVLIARIMVGFALAGASQGATLMLEYLPSTKRATISIMIQIFWSVGGIFEYFIAMIIIPTYGWRLQTLISAIPVGIIVICIYFVPESPRFFVASGRPDKADSVLRTIAKTNNRPLPSGRLDDAQAEEECGSIKQLFHITYKRTSFLLAFMWITVAMSYYGLILINTSIMTLGKSSNASINSDSKAEGKCKMLSTDDYKSLMLTTVGEMVGVPLLIILLLRIGRCRLCFLNFFAASLCFALFLAVQPDQTRLINMITFTARMFINSQFGLLYLYTMEVYPTVIRAMAVGCASSMSRLGAMITPYLAQVLIKKTYHGTIGIYIVATAMSAIFALFLPIETRGRELKQTTSERSTSIALSDDPSKRSRWSSTVDHIKTFIHVPRSDIDADYQPLVQDENLADETN